MVELVNMVTFFEPYTVNFTLPYVLFCVVESIFILGCIFSLYIVYWLIFKARVFDEGVRI